MILKVCRTAVVMREVKCRAIWVVQSTIAGESQERCGCHQLGRWSESARLVAFVSNVTCSILNVHMHSIRDLEFTQLCVNAVPISTNSRYSHRKNPHPPPNTIPNTINPAIAVHDLPCVSAALFPELVLPEDDRDEGEEESGDTRGGVGVLVGGVSGNVLVTGATSIVTLS